jgi:hypothetical protein
MLFFTTIIVAARSPPLYLPKMDLPLRGSAMKRINLDISIKLSLAACLFGVAAILGALR